jgi:hypothetical protein
MIIQDIKALLVLFQEVVPDHESNRLVWRYCNEKEKWHKAHSLFSTIRDRNLAAISKGDVVKECQYCFEEVCVETLYNLTNPKDPFDADTPYWIVKNALALANALEVDTDLVVEIVAPNKYKSG